MSSDEAKGVMGFNPTLVLQALSRGCRYGLEVIELTGLSSGTVYPALRRMESQGLVRSEWEDEEEARVEGRPARKYYRLTAPGERALKRSLEALAAQRRALGLEGGSAG